MGGPGLMLKPLGPIPIPVLLLARLYPIPFMAIPFPFIPEIPDIPGGIELFIIPVMAPKGLVGPKLAVFGG